MIDGGFTELHLMPLPGVVPFPPSSRSATARRATGRTSPWRRNSPFAFHEFHGPGFPGRRRAQYTYARHRPATDNLALNLLELGLKPLDRVVPTLPNCAEFVILYFALQKIGCIPIAALVTHRFAEISQFVQLSGAAMCVYPERQGDFEFEPMIQRVKAENPSLEVLRFASGSSETLIASKPEPQESELQKIQHRSDRSLHLPALGRHDRASPS